MLGAAGWGRRGRGCQKAKLATLWQQDVPRPDAHNAVCTPRLLAWMLLVPRSSILMTLPAGQGLGAMQRSSGPGNARWCCHRAAQRWAANISCAAQNCTPVLRCRWKE